MLVEFYVNDVIFGLTMPKADTTTYLLWQTRNLSLGWLHLLLCSHEATLHCPIAPLSLVESHALAQTFHPWT